VQVSYPVVGEVESHGDCASRGADQGDVSSGRGDSYDDPVGHLLDSIREPCRSVRRMPTVFRRRRSEATREVADAFVGFVRTVERIERAKASLLAAVPGGRGGGLAPAEALAGFEAGLLDARREMDGWRAADLEMDWERCSIGLEEASRRAEHLRLKASPEGYEQLYGTLADLLDPLEAFVLALERFDELGLP